MKVNGWKYYNHAAIPTCAPHQDADVSAIESGDIWNLNGKKPLLARWTTDFDCGYETNWWYVIKDTPFDINALKAKRRYEVNKGIKNFDVRVIDPREYKEELFYVQKSAFSAYPAKYRPKVEHDTFTESIDNWTDFKVYGAFFKETGKLCGYSFLGEKDNCAFFYVQKADPEYESYAVNAALVYGIVTDYDEFLKNGGYICDGEKSISHETAFQDYLEKYFDFRKAYCRLQIEYKPGFKSIVKLLFPMRRILSSLDSVKIVHQINSVMKMEELVREQK